MQKVVHEYALRVIVREEVKDPPVYQTRHPLIARTVFKNLLGSDQQYRVIRHIIQNINYSNMMERSVMYQLLDAEDRTRVPTGSAEGSPGVFPKNLGLVVDTAELLFKMAQAVVQHSSAQVKLDHGVS